MKDKIHINANKVFAVGKSPDSQKTFTSLDQSNSPDSQPDPSFLCKAALGPHLIWAARLVHLCRTFNHNRRTLLHNFHTGRAWPCLT